MNGPAERIREAHAAFDVALERLFQKGREGLGVNIPCKRGCDACCYEPLTVTNYEMVPIFARIRTFSVAKRGAILVRLAQHLADAGAAELLSLVPNPMIGGFELADIRKYRNAHIPCPLLDPERHECTVYEDRPFGCRAHHVLGDDASACSNVPDDGIPELNAGDILAPLFDQLLTREHHANPEPLVVGFLAVQLLPFFENDGIVLTRPLGSP